MYREIDWQKERKSVSLVEILTKDLPNTRQYSSSCQTASFSVDVSGLCTMKFRHVLCVYLIPTPLFQGWMERVNLGHVWAPVR
jgi:hypothetical protein